MRYLITGGCGFLGSNIAEKLIKENEDVIVFDSLFRVGACQNLEWLRNIGEFTFIQGDIRNRNDVEILLKNAKPDIVFHLAGQVAMTSSIENPRLDFEVNTIGSFNVLEAVRNYVPKCRVIYSSTNKVYGDLEGLSYSELSMRFVCNDYPNGFDELLSLDFHSPYGCSKGAADQYMRDYYRIYGVQTIVFRHSSMYGGRQFATSDQGWIGWFVKKALEIKHGISTNPLVISGNGKQVRDVLFSSDMADLYIAAARNTRNVDGEVFNIGGGIDNSLSILELFYELGRMLDIEIQYDQLPPRKSDQKYFVANIDKVKKLIGWSPKIAKWDGLLKMLKWQESLLNL